MDAVAERFSGSWETGSDIADDYIVAGGKRVAVEITTLKRRGVRQRGDGKPGLRFDRVAMRLIERLEANLAEVVPDGVTLLLTITAPIRLPSKTAAAVERAMACGDQRRSDFQSAGVSLYLFASADGGRL